MVLGRRSGKQADLAAYPQGLRRNGTPVGLDSGLAGRYPPVQIKITDAHRPGPVDGAPARGAPISHFIIAGQKYHGWNEAVVEGMIRSV